jgi:hypothetical protein
MMHRRLWMRGLMWVPVATTAMVVGPRIAAAKDKAKGRARHARICETLKCTEAQEVKLQQVIAELRKDVEPDRESIRKLRGQQAAEFAKDKPSEKKLRSAQAEIAKHRAEISARMHDAMMELHAILNSTQRKELAKIMERGGMRRLMKGHHHRSQMPA